VLLLVLVLVLVMLLLSILLHYLVLARLLLVVAAAAVDIVVVVAAAAVGQEEASRSAWEERRLGSRNALFPTSCFTQTAAAFQSQNAHKIHLFRSISSRSFSAGEGA